MPDLGQIFTAALLRSICVIALIAIDTSQVSAETELARFFPSVPIHEDDRLDETYEATFNGCIVKLTETSRFSVSVHTFDVLSYETDPGRLSWPRAKHTRRFSTRYIVPWYLRTEVQQAHIKELNARLRNLGISWKDRRTLSAAEIQKTSEVLQTWLSEIRAGRHGSFAQKNHMTRFRTMDEELLVAVRINNTMFFPVRKGNMPSLAHAMYRHSLVCHLERFP